jgi:hypothetical protein
MLGGKTEFRLNTQHRSIALTLEKTSYLKSGSQRSIKKYPLKGLVLLIKPAYGGNSTKTAFDTRIWDDLQPQKSGYPCRGPLPATGDHRGELSRNPTVGKPLYGSVDLRIPGPWMGPPGLMGNGAGLIIQSV